MANIICIKCRQEKKRFALSMCCACYTRERKARINQQCSHCKKQPPIPNSSICHECHNHLAEHGHLPTEHTRCTLGKEYFAIEWEHMTKLLGVEGAKKRLQDAYKLTENSIDTYLRDYRKHQNDRQEAAA